MKLRDIILVAIVGWLVIVGVPLIKTLDALAQTDKIYFQETQEYQLAKRLANSNLRMNCKQFADLWKVLFPESECRRFKTNIGTMHWECRVVENIWIDANWDLAGSIRTYTK
jgi:hypothetical protein